jgi:two-component system sensor histidine kinase KdpD
MEGSTTKFSNRISRPERGKLKIYLGYAAGVGKSYRMLEEAQRLLAEGQDVVIGVLESHGRPHTLALAEGLETVPRRRVNYRGLHTEGMDLEAILKRRPSHCMVDELAHTNVPGSLRPKRYMDVQELLGAGIHVIATMNVQHLESLYNTVEEATGVRVRERVPDLILGEADEVVNVDLAPTDLQKRLREGNVFQPSQISRALENYFKTENLELLREMTLRELARLIDFRLREDEEENTKGSDQLMVALSFDTEHHASLLRFASRLAGPLNRNWYAVQVQNAQEALAQRDASSQQRLSNTLTLANQLGAVVFTLKGEEIPKTLIQFALNYRIGHLVVGKPKERTGLKRWSPSIVDALVKNREGISVTVVDVGAWEARRKLAKSADEESLPKPQERFRTPRLSELLDVSKILFVGEQLTYRELIGRVMVQALRGTGIRTGEALDAILQRESLGSTVLNDGVALPHASLASLQETRVGMAFLRSPIRDLNLEHPIELIFLLLTPSDATRSHLELLSVMGRAFQDQILRSELKDAGEATQVLAALRAWERRVLKED